MGDAVKWVDVVNADGEVMEGFSNPVPAHWVGTDLLPAGAKKKGRSGGSSSTAPPKGQGAPAKTENRDVLEAYAVEKAGLTADEAKGFGNRDDLHAEIVKRAASV